jgi:xanthine dehydrogenase YagS FAD-binding subunit
MKRGVVSPERLVDINHLALDRITRKGNVLRIGATARNSDVAAHPVIREKHPLLAQALEAGASGQIRNMATVGGNIMQRTRCTYFYDRALPCNKRSPGTGCGALEGINRNHAIFGVNENALSCIAVHPSDMCVALAALEATVVVTGAAGERRIPFDTFHRLPGNAPDRDTVLEDHELILAVELKENGFQNHAHYLKIRDRASFDFALVSVAAALEMDGGQIRSARLAMGGVAHKPWRLYAVEKMLENQTPSEDLFARAGALGIDGARSFGHNEYKLKLATGAIKEALRKAAESNNK